MISATPDSWEMVKEFFKEVSVKLDDREKLSNFNKLIIPEGKDSPAVNPFTMFLGMYRLLEKHKELRQELVDEVKNLKDGLDHLSGSVPLGLIASINSDDERIKSLGRRVDELEEAVRGLSNKNGK